MASADVGLDARPYIQDPSAPDPNNGAPQDAFDDLFNYDTTADGVFRDRVSGDVDASNNSASRNAVGFDIERDLGIDEEIKVRKPRAPVAKLDEDRLLSAKGLSKLRKVTKERLRFKGKGHEFSDVARLLGTYQLWLDDLFPKAKFADGLSMIEKLGHKKRIQTLRREWINETKPQLTRNEDDLDNDFVDGAGYRNDDRSGRVNASGTTATSDLAKGREARSTEDGVVLQNSDGAERDDDIWAEATPERDIGRDRTAPQAETGAEVEEPERDELDDLLEEDAAQRSLTETSGAPNRALPKDDNDFADDMEAMQAIDDSW